MEAEAGAQFHWRPWTSPAALRIIAAAAGMLCIGAILVLLADGSLVMLLLGWPLLALTLLAALFVAGQRLATPNPVVAVNADGFFDRRLLRRPLPWSAFDIYCATAANDPTVFLHLRANRLDLVHRTSPLSRLPYAGLGHAELAVVLAPLQADAAELCALCRTLRSAEIARHVPAVREALRQAAADLSGGRRAPDLRAFAKGVRDGLFLVPIGGPRGEDTLFATDEAGRTYLTALTDVEPGDAGADLPFGNWFLFDLLEFLRSREEVGYILFDPGTDREIRLDRVRFEPLSALL